jgi:hypothetical protein
MHLRPLGHLSGGGESGIRTHGAVAGTPDFESGTFDHSVISPRRNMAAGLWSVNASAEGPFGTTRGPFIDIYSPFGDGNSRLPMRSLPVLTLVLLAPTVSHAQQATGQQANQQAAAPAVPARPAAASPAAARNSAASASPGTSDSWLTSTASRTLLGPELLAGLVTTLSHSADYDDYHPLDVGYSAGLWYRSPDRYAVGARYELSRLGSGESQSGVESIETQYSAHVLWAGGRLYPYLQDELAFFVGVRLGLSFLHRSASGVRSPDFTRPAGDPFSCSSTAAPNLGFAASMGFNASVAERLQAVAEVSGSMLRGSSDFIDGCAPGLGSPVTLNTQLGLAYYWDL